MKSKISRILGVGLSLAMLLSFLGPAMPVSASTLSWGGESSVEDLGNRVDYIIGPSGVDILDLAVNGQTIYAVTGTTTSDNATFKSTDGGATWRSLVTSTDYPGPSSGAPVLVAVAPDNANVVVIVTDEPEVWLSTDGGGDWDDLNILTGVVTIRDIDVSRGPTHYVVIGGSDGTNAEIWTLKLAMAEVWDAESGEGPIAGTSNLTADDEVFAVKFSPNFQTDKAIVAISSENASTGDPYLHIFRWKEDELGRWNSEATAYNEMSAWGSGLRFDVEASIVTGTAKADIALPDTFLASEVFERIIVVAAAGTGGGGGISGFTDTSRNEFEDWAGDDIAVGIHSVAIHSSGKVLAGAYADNVVYAFSKFTGSPEASRTNTLKPPSGVNRTLVAWTGDTAIATTSGDESAFSTSTDNGYAWNDISMIDTRLTTLADVAVNADGSKIYLTSYDATVSGTNDASVWLKASNWQRVFSRMNVVTASAPLMVRLAPENDAVVYVASKSSQDLWRSTDSGLSRWRHVPVDELTAIQDYVVQSADVAYAIDTNGATKTTTGGASWGDKKGLDGVAGFMVTLAPNGDVLVGGSDGYVAFSKDGGATFTKITDKTDTDKVYVVADEKYATSNILFIAAGDEVEIGAADKNESWSSFEPAALSDNVTGIAFYKGVLYVLTYNGLTGDDAVSQLWRSLNPYDPDTEELALWSRTLEEEVAYGILPQALKASFNYKKGPRFWAIDTEGKELNRVTDPIALVGPKLKAPKDKAKVSVNTASGAAYDVTFSWERYSDKRALNMDIEIAQDKDFTALVVDETVHNIDKDTVSRVIGPGQTGDWASSFMPGSTYYWRVRHSSDQTGTGQDAEDWHWNSPWSEVRSFKVDTLEVAAPFTILSPASGAYNVPIQPILTWTEYEKAIHYEVVVAEDATFNIIDFSYTAPDTFFKVPKTDELKYATTYYWRVRGVTGPEKVVKKQIVVPAGPWATGVFTTQAKPVEPTPPVVIEPTPPTKVEIVQVPVAQPAAIPAGLLWAVIAIGAVLVIALIVLIVRTRRVA